MWTDLYNANNLSAGIEAANRLLARQKARFGEQHVETAFAHGTLAIGLSLSGRDDDALREFKVAIPILVSAMRSAEASADTDDTGDAAARAQGTQSVIKSYIRTLARVGAGDAALETFRLAELIRGRSVQQALVASSARAAAGDPVLADLVRKEQDLGKQIGAQLGQLNNVLASPPEQRDDKLVRDIGADVDKLRAARTGARQEIARRFPSYADLIDPKPPNVDEIKATLKPDEALLSFYFGIQSSFVWAVPKDGAVVFAAIPMSAGDIDGKIRKLRKALEPEAITIDQIPPFDLALAHDLYALLLQPVEAGWKPAKSLIMVTNGLLGELPLSLLPTAPVQIDASPAPMFAAYRQVPWLARSHAITVVPSASALLTLRHLPPGSPNRDKLIGFGDPYFNEQEAIEAERHEPTEKLELASASADAGDAAVTRGLSFKLRASPHTEDVDSADLAMLPRLPDTRAELIAMAHALDVDPGKALYLGREANEHNVEINQFVALPNCGLCDPRARSRRPQRTDAAGSGADRAPIGRRARRRLADDGEDIEAQARRRLGRAVSLQYRRRCGGGRGGGVGIGPCVFLRGNAGAARHQLVGALRLGAGTDCRSVPTTGRRSRSGSWGSPAAGDDVDGRRSRLR